jgi:hypothetical protein
MRIELLKATKINGRKRPAGFKLGVTNDYGLELIEAGKAVNLEAEASADNNEEIKQN